MGTTMNKKTALFAGSFDPYTNGHHDIVMRGLDLFDEIIICIGHNSNKQRYFDVEFMVEKISGLYKGNDNIKIVKYNVLTAHLAKDYNANFLLRGLRNTTDFEYENSISQVNRNLKESLETVFLITSPRFAYISSSIIREVHKYGGDVSAYIPYSL